MSQTPMTTDDPRLTDYVLGELNPQQRADVEAQLAADPQLRQFVDELRIATAAVFDALQSESVPTLTEAQRSAIHAAALPAAGSQIRPSLRIVEAAEGPSGRRGLVSVIIATAVCAAILIGVSLMSPSRPTDSAQLDRSRSQWELLALHDMDPDGVLPQEIAEIEPDTSDSLGVIAQQRQSLSELVRVETLPRNDYFSISPTGEAEGKGDAGESGDAEGSGAAAGPAIASGGAAEMPARARDGTLVPGIRVTAGGAIQRPVLGDLGNPVPLDGAESQSGPSASRGETLESLSIAAPQPGQQSEMATRPGPETSTPPASGDKSGNDNTRFLRFEGESGYARPALGGEILRSGRAMVEESLSDGGGQRPSEPLRQYPQAGAASSPDPNAVHPGIASPSQHAPVAAGIEFRAAGAPIMSNAALPETELLLETLGRSEFDVSPASPLDLGRGLERDRLRRHEVRPQTPGTEAYAPIFENDFLTPTDAPLSTFGLDVDTASYANVRRFLMDERRLPPRDAVRIEELVNYFAYSDPQPAGGEPVGVSLEAAACPWNAEHRLVRIGLKAKAIDLADRPPTSLVFLIDTSGSMRDEKKLPLVKQSLRLLAYEMSENDRIAIVTYSTNAGLLLGSTSGEHQDEIIAAIEGLNADGSTNGEAGLKLAYDVATRHFIGHGQNRVILCTDGDFNVGTSDTDPLVRMISRKRDSGVFLSICGYGTGNIKDEKLERLADTGNGQYHYIDDLKEARKVFLDELTGTLYTVAKDVKLQVEFNPRAVGAYRLLGYENRALAAQDFNNDRVDSGDMGAGHSVTALYEIVPAGVTRARPASDAPGVDPLKYQQPTVVGGQRSENDAAQSDRSAAAGREERTPDSHSSPTELLTVKLRYKQPDGDESVKREFPLVDNRSGTASKDLEWSAAVASFGMLLRNSRHAGRSSLEGVLQLAEGARGRDESGRRREFLDMVLQTRSLDRRARGEVSPQPRELSSVDAREKASVGGKYRHLLDKLEARTDVERYGTFHDYGWSAEHAYAGHEGLPAGYWVYVFPDWYIWGENVSAEAKSP